MERTSEPLSSHFISGGGRGGVINRINADLVTHIYPRVLAANDWASGTIWSRVRPSHA